MPEKSEENAHLFVSIWRVYWLPIVFGVVSVIFIALAIAVFIKSYQSAEPITFFSDQNGTQSEESTQSAVVSDIAVDVEGAVVRPGVYHLSSGTHVDDAIAAA
jgi:competence protein ComEA